MDCGYSAAGSGFFERDEWLAALAANRFDLERVQELVEFEMFIPALDAAVPRGNRCRDGRPPFDHDMLMFKVLILQAMQSLSHERAKVLVKDRLSFMRFLEPGLSDNFPNANMV